MEGRLSKWTNVVKGWQYRWFVLDKHTGILSYYTSKEKMARGIRRGCLKVTGAVIAIDDEDGNTFSITTASKTFHLQAKDREELEKWVYSLEDVSSNFVYDDNCPSALELDLLLLSSSAQDFDKKLNEADAYMQIILVQINSLETKMDLELDPEKKLKYETIINHTKNILDEVKHAIVLLQIAKNSVQDNPGKYEPLDPCRTFEKMSNQCSTTQALVDDTETSDSSIEEDEDFYDANDSNDCKSQTKSNETHIEKRNSFRRDQALLKETRSIHPIEQSFPSHALHNDNITEKVISAEEEGIVDSYIINDRSSNKSSFMKSDGTLDYDALYENSDQGIVTMENQGSVIAHLLSQIKIGMDLTKVALPIFILETRSLLEMYADYFAHPDMFVKIADLSTERVRMIQVVRWYLCSYHAGRKCSVAKKPYNPVLGEIFQCHWDIPGDEYKVSQPVLDGPVPWCTGNQLTFVAEQVSHHPPVSAFYAEHYDKQISFNAFVWTKSKFLGLSIGVHNIGHGVINVLKYDEEYVVTFPNGYGRSILTVPWIELGGPVVITCKKSGYRATLDFLTKPFYGGKKHRVSAEVFAPNEKAPFLTLTGEWNGTVEAKWCDGRTELFADVNDLPIIKKNVRPIEKQSDMESRKLWKEVTAGLKLNNISRATNAKCNLEQKQRLEAQKRKELGISWKTKLFKRSDEGGWIYVKPLSERLLKENGGKKITDKI